MGRTRDATFMRQLILGGALLMVLFAYYVYAQSTSGRWNTVAVSGATSGVQVRGGRGAMALESMVAGGGDEEREYSKLIKYDWMKPRPLADILKNFREHIESPQWQQNERTLSCGDNEADELVMQGVRSVQRLISGDFINPVSSVEEAANLFQRAIDKKPDCHTATLNLAILIPQLSGDDSRVYTILQSIPQGHKLYAKALMWRAIAHELRGDHKEAHDQFLEAFALKPELSVQYFGKPADVWGRESGAKRVSMFEDPRLKSEEGYRIQVVCMKKLLLYNEYARHFSGYNHFTLEQARQFHESWYAPVKNLLPPYPLRALQECYRQLMEKNILRFDDKQAKRYFHHNSAPARFLGGIFAEFISRVWGNQMKSTYAYMGGYPSGSVLKPHVDRSQCEITMSVAIDVNPAEDACPIGMSKNPKRLTKDHSFGPNIVPDKVEDRAYTHLMAGDAVFFRGRALVHWRERIPDGMNCTNLFLHYVNWDFVGKLD